MKKIILGLFVMLAALLLGAKALNVKAAATIKMTDGAAMRLGSSNDETGIRFEAEVSEHVEGAIYGMVFANGKVDEANKANLVIGGEFGGKPVVDSGAKSENQINELKDGKFAVSMVKFREEVYTSYVSARAYYKVGDAEPVYSEQIVTRSLAEVALAYANEHGVQSGSLVESIINYVNSNYKKTHSDLLGSYFIDSSVYESNPAKLYAEFAKDWNAKFGTTLSGDASIDIAESDKSSTQLRKALDGAKSFSQECNLYKFFTDDSKMHSKWDWLLTYILEETSNNDALTAQIQAIRGEISKIGDDTWYNGYSLISRLGGFFAQRKYNAGAAAADFDKNPAWYGKILNHNTTVYSVEPTFIKVGSEIVLPVIATKDYYNEGWYNGEAEYEQGSKYVVSLSDVQLIKKYIPIEYIITYMDGDKEITTLSPTTYNYESGEITLPKYSKDGYSFDGWYDNPEFSGETVSKIEAASNGNKVFYAKTTKTENVSVNVTYDLNGGKWNDNVLVDNVLPSQKFTITRYLGYDSVNGFEASIYNSTPAKFWKYIALQKTAIENVYTIVQIADGSANVTAEYDLVIMWHSNNKQDNKSALDNIFNSSSSYVGDYVLFENTPGSASSSCNITVYVFEASELTKTITKEYVNAEVLPTPVREGYTFKGWLCSVDSQVYYEFPGYKTNPGDITYTAQWEANA